MAAGATYEPIQTYTLGSAAASITFSSIAASWTDLRVVWVCTTATNGDNLEMRFNGDTGTNYSFTHLDSNGTAAASVRLNNWDAILPLNYNVNTSSTIPTFYSMDIFSYSGSTYKTVLTTAAMDKNGSGGTSNGVGLWRNTSAITNIQLKAPSGNLNAGTVATLYGIKAA